MEVPLLFHRLKRWLACWSILLFFMVHPYAVKAGEIMRHPYGDILPDTHLHVLVTWDGGKSFSAWQDLLDFSKNQVPVKHTFFVSSVYYIANQERAKYSNYRGSSYSDIGYGGTLPDIEKRIKWTEAALADGHELASHLNGHFDGTKWTTQMWKIEMDQFVHLMGHALAKKVHTVRFPLLAYNKNVYASLIAHGYRSIFSSIDGKHPDAYKLYTDEENNLLIVHPIGCLSSRHYPNVLSMDYNIWVHDKRVRPKASVDALESMLYETYLNEAEKCKKANRPFVLSHHFSNFLHPRRNAYLAALKRVLKTIHETYPVRFLTVSELDDLVLAHHQGRPAK